MLAQAAMRAVKSRAGRAARGAPCPSKGLVMVGVLGRGSSELHTPVGGVAALLR